MLSILSVVFDVSRDYINRPVMTFAVDWALTTNYQSILVSIYRHFKSNKENEAVIRVRSFWRELVYFSAFLFSEALFVGLVNIITMDFFFCIALFFTRK